uniref:(northern house mosquito) hypothetical protein n=1 Tax=Culex pipiens TaxID=7175 RepID=A0A8D8BFC6_CULPI
MRAGSPIGRRMVVVYRNRFQNPHSALQELDQALEVRIGKRRSVVLPEIDGVDVQSCAQQMLENGAPRSGWFFELVQNLDVPLELVDQGVEAGCGLVFHRWQFEEGL